MNLTSSKNSLKIYDSKKYEKLVNKKNTKEIHLHASLLFYGLKCFKNGKT